MSLRKISTTFGLVGAAALATMCGGEEFAGGPKGKGGADAGSDVSGRAGTGGSKGGGAGSGGAGSGGEAATSGASGASGSSGAAGDDGAAGAGGSGGAPPCDPNERPADGSFVSVSGNDTTGDGSASLPLKSIRQGLAAAAAAGKSVVYVDQGTYPESLALTTANSGVTVRGGFRATGATWQRDCSDGARAKTVVASPTNVGARVTGVTQKTTLESLTILTRASGSSSPGQAGESCYGVFVAGAGSPLSLVDVQVTAGSGGAGGPVTATGPSPGVSCNPFTGCSDGALGTPGAHGLGAPAGAFGVDGYGGGDGANAAPGTAGHQGTPGAGPQVATCRNQGCSGGTGLCLTLLCGNLGSTQTVSSTAGTCGCGGAGGGGGLGGRSGGASIALFVSGSGAAVNVIGSVLTAKPGGDGSSGAAGQDGTAGTQGAAGMNATCWGNCESVNTSGAQCTCAQPSSYTLPGGVAGGPGGKGGLGGKGGGGAGGPSIGIVRLGDALAVLEGTSSIQHDAGGKGADGAAAGASQETLVVP